MTSFRPYPSFTIDDADEILFAWFLTGMILGIPGGILTIFGHPNHMILFTFGIIMLIPITLFAIWVIGFLLYLLFDECYGGAINNFHTIRDRRAEHQRKSKPHSTITIPRKDHR